MNENGKETTERLTEEAVTSYVRTFLIYRPKGNWHEDGEKEAPLSGRGPDLILVGGKRSNEYFIIECKGRSYAKTARTANRDGWLNALGLLITRMDMSCIKNSEKTKDGKDCTCKYGLGLYWVSAQAALLRIPKDVAKALHLNVFSVYDDGTVKQWTPKMFGKEYLENDFKE